MDHIGIDVHQKYREICVVSEEGEVLGRATIPTTRASLERWFGGLEPARVALEAGGSTNWVARILDELGHEVTVVNPRRVRLIAKSTLKTDAIDAEVLARLSRLGRELRPTSALDGARASPLTFVGSGRDAPCVQWSSDPEVADVTNPRCPDSRPPVERACGARERLHRHSLRRPAAARLPGPRLLPA